MKALVCRQWGDPDSLNVETLPAIMPAAGELVVGLKTAGINFPDALMVQGKYQLKPPFPFSAGLEGAGVVKSVGAGVEGWKPGDRVMLEADYGCFAEEIAVPVDHRLTRLPDAIGFDIAAAFPIAYNTSLHALKDRGQIKAGETLLVLGASGGVGIAAVQIGKLMGARVIACASSQAKLELCRQHGADATIDYDSGDFRQAIRDAAGSDGIDVIFDPVGGRYSEPAFRSINWCGRFLVVGFAAGSIAAMPLNLPLLKGAAIVGVLVNHGAKDPNLFQANLQTLLGWIESGELKPVLTRVYAFDEAKAALNDLLGRRITGKAILKIG